MEVLAFSGRGVDDWLAEDVVVKVVNKRLAEGAYYKRKGVMNTKRKSLKPNNQ